MASDKESPSSNREPISLKYANIENERRFLIRNPVAIPINARRLYIQDRYLVGTRLRLRSVEESGLPTVFKLGQKIRFDGGSPSENAHTTIYLSAEEFDLLAQLPANELEKVRWIDPIGNLSLAIEEFGGRLAGLVLAEVDLGTSGSMPSTFPIELSEEVTNDERFTGGELAKKTTQQLTSILDSFDIH